MLSYESITLSPLGKKSLYINTYDPSLLFPIPRKLKRDELSIPKALPFYGTDIWNAYEISWLNPKGKPQIALGEFSFFAESANLIESKSFKLYLNSFNQTKLDCPDQLINLLEQDLSQASGSPVAVTLFHPNDHKKFFFSNFSGISLDSLDISTESYELDPSFLKTTPMIVEEQVFSSLLKSNCLVTGQPDWGSVFIHYKGPQIDHEGLLKYIVSFRNHNEFHEQCVERIFMDLLQHCKPDLLTVFARYTRRGGLDINPFRSNWDPIAAPSNHRHPRQ